MSIEVSVTKSGTPGRVLAGTRVDYRVLVANRSPYALAGVTVRDLLPEGLTLLEGSLSPAPQRGETLCGGVSLGGVPRGSCRCLSFAARVSPQAAGTLENRAEISYWWQEPAGSRTGTAVSEPTVSQVERVELTLSLWGPIYRSGESPRLLLTAENRSTLALEGLRLRLPALAASGCTGVLTLEGEGQPGARLSAGILVPRLEPGAAVTAQCTLCGACPRLPPGLQAVASYSYRLGPGVRYGCASSGEPVPPPGETAENERKSND